MAVLLLPSTLRARAHTSFHSAPRPVSTLQLPRKAGQLSEKSSRAHPGTASKLTDV
jgi:hypothetical protein